MRYSRILAACGLLAAAAGAQAEVSASAAIVSDYDYRGITQTLEDPAVQLSIDYAHDSGWYLGAWGTNVDFGTDDPSHEIDLYTGFSGSAGDLGYDVGLLYYAYPGESDLNFLEIYGSLSYSIFTGGLHFSNDFAATDESGIYVYADVAIPVGPVSIDLHAGYSDGDSIELLFGDDSYADYSAGLSYTANNFTVSMKWVITDFDAGSDDRVILGFSTSFPWE